MTCQGHSLSSSQAKKCLGTRIFGKKEEERKQLCAIQLVSVRASTRPCRVFRACARSQPAFAADGNGSLREQAGVGMAVQG